jgi:hypothetical protein
MDGGSGFSTDTDRETWQLSGPDEVGSGGLIIEGGFRVLTNVDLRRLRSAAQRR